MKRSFPFLVRNAALVASLLCAVAASTGRCNAQTVLYRLNTDSAFQQGCFAPCLCPVMIGAPVKGTFLLTPKSFDGLFSTYAVTDVNWSVLLDGATTAVTGSGTYKFGGEFALEQELSLELQMGGGKPARFDSGLVVVSVPWPEIKVTISTNGLFCYDTAFNISASPTPVPPLHLGLAGADSLTVSWPVSSIAFVLQESSDLTPTSWTTVTNAPIVTGQQIQVVLARSPGSKFYRLLPSGN